ncbi:MAG: hypothetical protein U0903_00360 [Planctomycetales bacterium]
MKRMSVAALLLCLSFSSGCCSCGPGLFSSIYDPCGTCCRRPKRCCGSNDFVLPPAPTSSCGCSGTAMTGDMSGMIPGEAYSQLQSAPAMSVDPTQFAGSPLPPPLPAQSVGPAFSNGPTMTPAQFSAPPMLQTMSNQQLTPMSYTAPQGDCPTCNQHQH